MVGCCALRFVNCNGDVWFGVSMVILRCDAIDLGLMRTKTEWWGHKSIRTWQLGWQAFPYFVADTWGCPLPEGDRITGPANIFHPTSLHEISTYPQVMNTCLVNSRIIPRSSPLSRMAIPWRKPLFQHLGSTESTDLTDQGKGVEPKGRWQCFCLENEKQQRLNQKGSQRDLGWRGRKTDTNNDFNSGKWLQFEMCFFFGKITLLGTIPQKGTS